MTHDQRDDATRLALLWDDLQTGEPTVGATDHALLTAIHHLEAATRTPPPPADLAIRTWEQLTGKPLPLVTLVAAPAPSTNGRYLAPPSGTDRATTQTKNRQLVQSAYRAIAIGAMAGMGAGFVAGAWTRIAMRIAGAMTSDQNRGLLTENDAAVGAITLDGTLSIAMFGALVGVFGGLLYIALRRRIPGNGWQRPLLYGVLLLATLGFLVMDQDNPDYRTFGPAWLNVGSFSLAYLIFGVCVGLLVDWLDRRLPRFGSDQSPARRALFVLGLAPFALLGSFALLTGFIGLVGPVGALALLLCLVLAWARPSWRSEAVSSVRSWTRLPSLVGYAAFALPSLVGLVLTLRAIVAILGG